MKGKLGSIMHFEPCLFVSVCLCDDNKKKTSVQRHHFALKGKKNTRMQIHAISRGVDCFRSRYLNRERGARSRKRGVLVFGKKHDPRTKIFFCLMLAVKGVVLCIRGVRMNPFVLSLPQWKQFESCGEIEVECMTRTLTTKSSGDGGRRLGFFCTFFFQLWRNKSELFLKVGAKQLYRLLFSSLFDMVRSS